MSCACGSERLVTGGGKTSDMFNARMVHHDRKETHHGYVPGDLGIGGGDYIELMWCLDCGRIQGSFPLPAAQLEKPKEEREDE